MLTGRARAAAPCVLFFDEFDAIAHKRSFGEESNGSDDGTGVYARLLSTFLNELDGVDASDNGKLLVITATNRKTALDPALIRPGRMDRTIEVGLPTLIDQQVRWFCWHRCTSADPLVMSRKF